VALVGLGVLSSSVGTAYNDSLSLPGTESTQALNLVQEASPKQAGAADTVVWRTDRGSVHDPAVEQRMKSALSAISRLPDVGAVVSPYDAAGSGQVSKDGRTAYASVTYTKQANDLDKGHIRKVVHTAQAARTDGLRVELGGPAVSVTEAPGAGLSEVIGVVAAAVVLFIAFGSLLAMAVPLVTAIAALGTATFGVGLAGHAFSVASLAPTLGALVGLGVGIDYALFIITRYRANLKGGATPEDAVVTAVNTSGRAVLFAGGTVVVALLGMFVLGLGFLDGVAAAAALTVLLAVIAAVTLLPAMLGFVKVRALSRRERRALAANGPVGEADVSGFWARWAGVVERRPKVLSAVAVAVMAVLMVPFFSLRLGSSDAGNSPQATTMRKAYDILADGFGPGFNGPLQLVARTGSAQDRAALGSLAGTVGRLDGVAEVTSVPAGARSGIGMIEVVPTTSPQSEKTSELIRHLRHDVIPPAEQADPGLKVYVGGQTAVNDDFADVLAGKMPLFVGVIVGLGFLLLLVAFRSLLVPLTAAVMNLVAAAASFGVMVAFFQWGWGSKGLGLGQGPVEPFLPVLMLPVLFGLSMDYQVFLVSRMHEEWVHTRENARAVIVGQSTTGRVITAAATIMIAVFCAFALGGERVIAEFGIGLATAVALDALVLRTVLVPAVMHLFGRANWWMPGWLDRNLPHLSVEPHDDPEVVVPQPALQR
jgi:RND superfamily putative drug exporter